MATNITFKNTDPWHSSVGSLYELDIIDWLLQHPDQYQTINDFQRRHYNIYSRNTDNGQIRSTIDSDNDTKVYLNDINTTFKSVNTKGIAGGIARNRYNVVDDPNSGDNADLNWKPEGLYGAYTDDRRVLGRKGDYDMSQLEEFADRLEPAGLEIYLDPVTNYYMIRPIGTGELSISNPNGSSGNNRDDLQAQKRKSPTDWISLYKTPKSSYPGWSDWIPLTMKKIVDDAAAVRTGMLERQKRFPLYQPPQEYAKVTDAYAQRQLLEKQKQEVLHRTGFNPTSDLAQNLTARTKGEEIAQLISDKQTELKSKEFAETSKLVQEVANKNIMYRTNVANLNIQSNVAAMNNIIDSRIKQNERLATNLDTYIGDMYTNFGEYLKTKRLNENAAKRSAAYKQFNSLVTEAGKAYLNLLEHPENWAGIQEFAKAIDPTQLTQALQQIWNTAVLSGNPYNDPAFVKMLSDLLKYGSSTTAQQYRARYEADLAKLQKEAEAKITVSKLLLDAILASIDTYVTNQWGWNPESKVHNSVLSRKSGGKINDTFSRLERIRQREQQSVRENTYKRNKLMQDSLNKQLDRISKEELALLRAVFK